MRPGVDRICRLALARLALVVTQAEGVAGWIEEYSDVLLGLGCGHRGSQGDRLCDGVRVGADQLALR